MTDRRIGTREEWLAAREKLLEHEKKHTQLADELARERRELPWVPVEKEYSFDTDDGEKALGELFDGRSQLLVYHFMFGPSYGAGCPTCSSIADGIDGVPPHLHARDLAFALVSQAPLEKLQALKRRMGWSILWLSSARTDFNFDLGFSSSEEQTREALAPMVDALPPIAAHNANATGTDLFAYLSEGFGFDAFVPTTGPSTTRTRRRTAESSSSWATTRSWTVHRRAATRATRFRSGSAGTTNTTKSDRLRGAKGRNLTDHTGDGMRRWYTVLVGMAIAVGIVASPGPATASTEDPVPIPGGIQTLLPPPYGPTLHVFAPGPDRPRVHGPRR